MTRKRFGILVGLMLFGIAVSAIGGSFGNPFASAGYRALRVPFSAYPRKIAGWTGVDVPLTKREIQIASLDKYLRRQYDNADGRSVLLYIAYYGNKERGLQAIYHNPTVCYPMAGWTPAGSHQTDVTLPDAAREFRVSLDRFRKEGQELVVLNFFIVNGEVLEESPRNKPIWLARDKLRISSGPGYFVQVQVVAVAARGERAAERMTISFLEAAGGAIFRHF